MLKSALLAGLIAGFVWMMISTLVDMSKNAVVIGGLAFLVGTALITFLISTVIVRSKSA